MACRCMTIAAVGVLVLLVGANAGAAQGVVVELHVGAAVGPPITSGLVGFNWRVGGEAVTALRPALVRSFAVRLARISPAPGILDFSASDAELDAVEATGATALAVLIERPPWDPGVGSAGYEQVIEAVFRRYLVERPAGGHRPVWFESGNEPEFPPTSHGQLPHELAGDVAAQVRALARVEAASGVAATYGGPGALFADPAIAGAFVAAARSAGRLPNFVSWHAYPNAPLLGPDGPEDRSSPAAVAVWQALHGVNPVASPLVLGAGIDVMRSAVAAGLLPGERPPALLITEWNISSGGFDRRNDTPTAGAHTIGSLIEMQTRGLAGSTFFAAVDRHCSNPDVNPAGATFCGDWGTASASGTRKPVWHAFALWQAMTGSTRTVDGADATAGLWALAAADATTVRVIAASFSVSQPADRRLRISVQPSTAARTVRVRRIDASHLTGETTVAPALAAGASAVDIDLPANAVALVEVTDTPTRAPAATSPPGAAQNGAAPPGSQLPATGPRHPSIGTGLLALTAALALGALGRRVRRRPGPGGRQPP